MYAGFIYKTIYTTLPTRAASTVGEKKKEENIA